MFRGLPFIKDWDEFHHSPCWCPWAERQICRGISGSRDEAPEQESSFYTLDKTPEEAETKFYHRSPAEVATLLSSPGSGDRCPSGQSQCPSPDTFSVMSRGKSHLLRFSAQLKGFAPGPLIGAAWGSPLASGLRADLGMWGWLQMEALVSQMPAGCFGSARWTLPHPGTVKTSA